MNVEPRQEVAMDTKTKYITALGMLCAIAYAVMIVFRIPVGSFLTYDPKDVIIGIGGFILGPMAAFLVASVVAFAEMVTVSDTGPIGAVMNMLASCSFSCTAAYLYKRKHTLGGAIFGLFMGGILMTIIMMLWNYLMIPLYLGVSRHIVMPMLFTLILPFNLIKSGLNMGFILLLYKPIVNALRRTQLLGESNSHGLVHPRAGVIIFSAVLLASCVLLILILRGIL